MGAINVTSQQHAPVMGGEGSAIFDNEASTGGPYYAVEFLTDGTLSALVADQVNGLSKLVDVTFPAGKVLLGLGAIRSFTCTGLVQAYLLEWVADPENV